MTPVRMSIIVALVFIVVGSLSSQQEPNPDRLFVRVQTTLRGQPTPTGAQVAILRPGTRVTALNDAPPSDSFVRVAASGGQEGWVARDSVRPMAFLVAEQELEPFGGLESVRGGARGARGGVVATPLAQCKPFEQCPITGCAVEETHKLTNTRKRTVPAESAPIKHLTLDDFELLQQLTDAKGIPQGEHLSAAQRKQLSGFQIGTHTISEGDHIALTGFIAEDRTIRCGGAESVNCGHKNAGNAPASSPCTRSDIHVPIVGSVTGKQIESVVVEPIPQGPNVTVWTPAAFIGVKKEGRRLLIRGGLFYDSIHIVNTDPNETGQPKRFTVWELHPVTAVFVCTRPKNACDVDAPADWEPLK